MHGPAQNCNQTCSAWKRLEATMLIHAGELGNVGVDFLHLFLCLKKGPLTGMIGNACAIPF
jgi:hypothetical protein